VSGGWPQVGTLLAQKTQRDLSASEQSERACTNIPIHMWEKNDEKV
jgi:hypothetical protein